MRSPANAATIFAIGPIIAVIAINDRSRMAKYVFIQNIKKKEDMKWWENCVVAILSLVNSNKTFFHKEEENV